MAGTVTVACKLPHGLVLRLFDMVDYDEAQSGGGFKTVKRAFPRDKTVTLNGYLTPHRFAEIQPAAPNSSYALTHGVDKDFFDEWMRQNASLAAVQNKLIFANEKQDSVNGMVRDNKARRCGMEPIDRDKLPRGVQTFKKDAA